MPALPCCASIYISLVWGWAVRRTKRRIGHVGVGGVGDEAAGAARISMSRWQRVRGLKIMARLGRALCKHGQAVLWSTLAAGHRGSQRVLPERQGSEIGCARHKPLWREHDWPTTAHFGGGSASRTENMHGAVPGARFREAEMRDGGLPTSNKMPY